MKPFVVPKVTVRRVVNLSLDDLAKRVVGEPSYVRVGLPDSITTEHGQQIRKSKRQGKALK